MKNICLSNECGNNEEETKSRKIILGSWEIIYTTKKSRCR